MFNTLMLPGQEDTVEDHYEDISVWDSAGIVCTSMTELLHGLMDIQYMPSKELATIYFTNNGIGGIMTSQMKEIESVEMVKRFPEQLEKAFCAGYADKLIIASRAIRKIMKRNEYKLMITKQLKELTSHNYMQESDLANLEDNVRKLWMEFQIGLNQASEDQRPSDWYYCSEKDPYYDNIIKERVTMKNVKNSLVGLEKALRVSKLLTENLTYLKAACMHLLMLASSLRPNRNPEALTQRHYSDICDYVLNVFSEPWPAWECPADIDLAQVVMTRHLSRAARKVAKFEKPTGHIAIQNLLGWFAVETYVVVDEVRSMHKSSNECVEALTTNH